MTTNKSWRSAALTGALTLTLAGVAQAATLTFTDNTNPQAFSTNPDTSGASNTAPLSSGTEVRFIDSNGSPVDVTGVRDTYFGGESWSFDGTGAMAAVSGTPSNWGASTQGTAPGAGSSAAPGAGTNPTIGQDGTLLFSTFNFLAPTTGALAGAIYGPATLNATFTSAAAGTISVLFPVLEMQWLDAWFPLGASQSGSDTPGVLFSGTFSGCSGSGLNCVFQMQAQETINNILSGSAGAGDLPDEDPVEAGFGGWTVQWEVAGTVDDLSPYVSAVPVPAAAWLFGSGLIGLVGSALRKRRS